MRSDNDQRSDDALVVGGLLVPEGAAAYATAMRWWGWTPGDAVREETDGCHGSVPPLTFIMPKRRQAVRLELLGAGYSLLERGGPAEGPFVRRWRLRVNVPGLRA